MFTSKIDALFSPTPIALSRRVENEEILEEFRHVSQGEALSWCWAAAGAMIYNHYCRSSLLACHWASLVLVASQPLKTSCDDPHGYDDMHAIDKALAAKELINLPVVAGPTSEERIRKEIREGRPVLLVQSGPNHVVVIYGILNENGRTLVRCADPKSSLIKRDLELISRSEARPRWSATIFTEKGSCDVHLPH